MTQSTIRRLWAGTLHLLEHALAVAVGFALVILGLALTFSVVLTLPGLIVLGLGVCLVVAGLFSHAFARPKSGA